MRLLVVYKESNYEIHGSRVESYVKTGQLASTILDSMLLAHNEHYRTLEKLKVSLDARQIPYDAIGRQNLRTFDIRHELVVTVGGDGTLLFTAQHLTTNQVPVVGVRSTDESVGYLCAVDSTEVQTVGERVLDQKFQFNPVERIKAEIKYAGNSQIVETPPVLNDFLFTNSNPAHTTRYRIQLGPKHHATHRSSGVWISSAIGSSAGISAAGGVIQPRQSNLFQFKARELYRSLPAVRELTGALFDPDVEPLVIDNYCESAIIALDGQHQTYELNYGDNLTFRRAPSLPLATALM